MASLANRVALVTGAGRGIGRGCAVALAQAGADIILNDRPGSQDLADAAAEIRAIGRRCEAIEADVFHRAGCEELLEHAAAIGKQVDILISNPALGHRAAFLDYDPAAFERVVQATLVAGFHIGQLVARQLVARGAHGKIVFISSVHATSPYQGSAAYNAAKAGLNHLATSIAAELAQHRINVNVIEPGWIDTPGERQTFGDVRLASAGRALPWERLGTPEDIGRAAAFLASDDADYITGAVLRVDGGFWFKDAR